MRLRHALTRTTVAVLVAAFALLSCEDTPDEVTGTNGEEVSVQDLGSFVAEAFATLPLILADAFVRLITVAGGTPVPGVVLNDNGGGNFDGSVGFDFDGDGGFESTIEFEADVTTGPGGEFLGAALTLSGSGPDVAGTGAVTASVLGGGALPIIGLSNGSFVILTGSDLQSGALLVINIFSFNIQVEPVGESVLLFGSFSFEINGISGSVFFDTDEMTGAQTVSITGTANGEAFEIFLP